jgi:hypothetical protein
MVGWNRNIPSLYDLAMGRDGYLDTANPIVESKRDITSFAHVVGRYNLARVRWDSSRLDVHPGRGLSAARDASSITQFTRLLSGLLFIIGMRLG